MPRATSQSQTRAVPSIDGPSSSLVISRATPPAMRRPWRRRTPRRRRPWRRSSSSCRRRRGRRACRRGASARTGRCVQAASGPVGTTSVWPAKTSSLPAGSLPRPVRPEVADALACRGRRAAAVQSKPIGAQALGDQRLAAGVVGRDRAAARSAARPGCSVADTARQKRRRFGERPATSSGRTSIVISVKLGWSSFSSFFGTIRETGVMSFCSRHIRLVGESA